MSAGGSMHRWAICGLLVFAACDDNIFGEPPFVPLTTEGWDGVQEVFDDYCLDCHGATAAFGQLDLETDPYGALVSVPSSNGSMSLVEPGDPDNSLLYLKLIDMQPPGSGSKMPPASVLAGEATDIVKNWIADGALQE